LRTAKYCANQPAAAALNFDGESRSKLFLLSIDILLAVVDS
jgi:hypothetical protein